MDVYNQTFLHYYPSDKKIIYKSNLLKSREKIKDPTQLLNAINAYLEENNDKRILKNHELQNLLNGSSLESIEVNATEEGFSIYDTYIDENSDIEKNMENSDALKHIMVKIKDLLTIEKKIIRLKGVDL